MTAILSIPDGATFSVLAYLGPGGGFAIMFYSLTILLVAAGVVVLIISSPLIALRAVFRRGRTRRRGHARQVVILGLDGLDPAVVTRLMDQGKLPHFRTLATEGHFSSLATSTPAMSPTAWSSFMTGRDASGHGIFGFLTRDPASCLPRLNSYDIVEPRRSWRVGKYRFPLSKRRVRMLRKGVPFWTIAARHGLEATVLRVPITFPPEPFRGRLVSGMCVPDLLGSQGGYSLYGTVDRRADTSRDGYHPLRFKDGVARTQIKGPRHPWSANERHLTVPMQVRRSRQAETVTLRVNRMRLDLKVGEYTDWVRLKFRAGPVTICGIVRFCLISCGREVEIYMTAIHVDPERPAMRIGHPAFFSDALAKQVGTFGTLGLMEDTSALNDGILDERTFLEQVWQACEERKAMLFATIERKLDDLVVCVFDTPDRVQHMFWRDLDDGEVPAAIEHAYVEMDRLVGQTLARAAKDTLLLVLSDHGFTSFRRGVNLNAWLHRNGYLHVLPGADRGADWLQAVDWSRTRAYALGLVGIFVNLKGREARGIVEPGEELDELLTELKVKLEELTDEDGAVRRAIRRVHVTQRDFDGPQRFDGPDLLIGFEKGYRCSREGARGCLSEEVFCDNTKHWSGDHCVDPALVPGVLFANRPLKRRAPHIMDVAPTVLDAFGLEPPSDMQGRSLLEDLETEPNT